MLQHSLSHQHAIERIAVGAGQGPRETAMLKRQ